MSQPLACRRCRNRKRDLHAHRAVNELFRPRATALREAPGRTKTESWASFAAAASSADAASSAELTLLDPRGS